MSILLTCPLAGLSYVISTYVTKPVCNVILGIYMGSSSLDRKLFTTEQLENIQNAVNWMKALEIRTLNEPDTDLCYGLKIGKCDKIQFYYKSW